MLRDTESIERSLVNENPDSILADIVTSSTTVGMRSTRIEDSKGREQTFMIARKVDSLTMLKNNGTKTR